MTDERTISVCPACDSAAIHINATRRQVNADARRYYCDTCGARFDEPAERPAASNGRNRSGLSKRLVEMDADDLRADGGTPPGGGYDHGIVGECTDCGGRMIEHAVGHGTPERTITLVCQDCGTSGTIRYEVGGENPWQDPSEIEGVTDTTVKPINWIECLNCHGTGWVVGCIDDICHARGVCMHDGNDPCPECHTSGTVPQVVETDGGESELWECPQCGEPHASIKGKVPGGCLHCVDLIRYIEYEAPGMGMVHNDVSEVVCFDEECEERVTVDPHTLVVEDDGALSIESEEYDPETGQTTGYTRVEIYCSVECRNNTYSISGAPATTVVEREDDDLRTDGGVNENTVKQQAMQDRESRIEGLRYRLDSFPDSVPDGTKSMLWGRIEGVRRAYLLTPDLFDGGYWDARIDDVEASLEWVERRYQDTGNERDGRDGGDE